MSVPRVGSALVALLGVAGAPPAAAQYLPPLPAAWQAPAFFSTVPRSPQDTGGTSWTDSKAFRISVAPAALIVSGLLVYRDEGLLNRQDIREARQDHFAGFSTKFDDFTRFAPALAVYGLNLAGIPGRHTVGRATLSFAVGSAIYLPIVFGLKEATQEPRPDGSTEDSFPSGHTAAAFSSAVFLEEEYGYRNRLYPVAGYAVASITGMLRVLNDRHWASDVLVGAGIGMLGTRLGYVVVDHFKGERGRRDVPEMAPSPGPGVARPHFVDIKGGASRLAGDLRNREGPLFGENGFSFGVEGAYFPWDHVGIGAEWTLSSFPLSVDNLVLPPGADSVAANVMATPIGTQSVYVGPYLDLALGTSFSLVGKLTAGWSSGADAAVILEVDPAYQAQLGTEVPLVVYTPQSDVGWAARLGVRGHLFPHSSVLVYAEYNGSTPDVEVTEYDVSAGGVSPATTRTLSNVNLSYYTLGAAVSIMAW